MPIRVGLPVERKRLNEKVQTETFERAGVIFVGHGLEADC